MNQDVEKKAKESGFDIVVEQPLNVDTLRNIIIPKIYEMKVLREKK